MPTEVTEQTILDLLKKVNFPGYSRDIVSFGLVKKITFCEGLVKIELKLTSSDANVPKKIEVDVKTAVSAVPGVDQVNVAIEVIAPKAGPGGAAGPGSQKGKSIPGVKHVIAVGSGKGGVGKSTVAVNLALSLHAQGHKVGLMDADVYGPSIPMMMGVSEKPMARDKKIIPLEAHGVKLISIGVLIDENAPAIWRGPIVSRVVQQFLQDVEWGELDYLIIDLPPGTGDIQLTLVQSVALSGAVIVTTPQAVALLDVIKANEMFKTVNTPILGVVENMSHYTCTKCSHEESIFSQGGAQKEAERIGSTVLGQIPIEPAVCQGGDSGKPIVIQESDSKAKQIFAEIAQKVVEKVAAKSPASA